MVNPLKRLRIGGDRLYIRVPQFPLSSPTCVKFYRNFTTATDGLERIGFGCRTAARRSGVRCLRPRVPIPRTGPPSGAAARPLGAVRGTRWPKRRRRFFGFQVVDCSPFTAKFSASSQSTSSPAGAVHESTSPWPSARSGRRALCLARPPICRTASWSLWFAWWVSAGAQATCATGCL